MTYAGICDRMRLTRKLAINTQISAVSEVSGGSDCNRNANSGTETEAVISSASGQIATFWLEIFC